MKSFSESILSRVKIPPEGRLLAAFSGGEDSLFLLAALSFLAPERTEALYVNHNIRGKKELEREIALNRKNASLLGIPFHTAVIPEGKILKRARDENTGVEAAARDERYRALKSYARENSFDWILTAHHEDDQSETVLMRMLDSSPFWQWGGIRERDGIVVRPMLSVSKREIRECIRESGLDYSVDSTNGDTQYRRNYIRHEILPLITDEEKRMISHIAENVAAMNTDTVGFTVLNPFYASFSRSAFLSSLPVTKEKTLYAVFSAFGEKERVSRRYLCEIMNAAERGSTRVANERYIFYIIRDEIRAYRRIAPFSSPFRGLDTLLPEGLRLDNTSFGPLTLKIRADVLSSSVIRTNRKGDTIELVDGKRKVSSLLKERKVPYALVLDTDGVINAVFTSFLGGRDRLSSSMKGTDGEYLSIITDKDN